MFTNSNIQVSHTYIHHNRTNCRVHTKIYKPLTSNEYSIKGSFAFAEEIVEQDSEFFMGSLDVDSLFTDIQLEETI